MYLVYTTIVSSPDSTLKEGKGLLTLGHFLVWPALGMCANTGALQQSLDLILVSKVT